MWFTTLFLLFLRVIAAPLDPMGTITLRTLTSSASNGPPTYKQLILEEWSAQNQLTQTWTPPCTLTGLSTEYYTEGILRSRYPFLDGIWFLCRDVPIGAPFSYSPAPVMIMNLEEFGFLRVYSSDNTTYPNSTTVNMVLPFFNETLGATIFYLTGGAAPASYPNPSRPLQPRIRVDYIPRAPPPPANFAGPLATLTSAILPSGLTIMTDSLYMPSLVTNFSIVTPTVYLMGIENSLPAGLRTPFRSSLFTGIAPQMLSFWSFPLVDIMWYTYFSLVPMIARTNFNTTDITQKTLTFPLPTSSSSGTIGGSSWRIVSGKYDMNNAEVIYISNGTMIMFNTLESLQRGQPFQLSLFAPSGYKFLDAYARSPNILPPIFPSPSAAPTRTPTPTVTRTSSRSASPSFTPTSSITSSRTPSFSQTPSITPSVSSSNTPTRSLSATPTLSATPSSSASSSSSQTPTSTITPSISASVTSSVSPGTIPSASSTMTTAPTTSSTPSNSITSSVTPSASGSVVVPPPANKNKETSTMVEVGVGTGVSVAVVAILGAFGFIAFRRIPAFRTYYIRTFGARAPKIPATSRIKPKQGGRDIEISENPFMLSQARAIQLREMQENMSLPSSRPRSLSKTKKEFTPNMSGIREVRVQGMRGLSV